MKKSLTRILTSFVILSFVNFMFSNVIFTHVHKGIDGRPITHSHPYLPAGHHSHSAHSLDLISTFNAASVSADAVSEATLQAPQTYSPIIVAKESPALLRIHTSLLSLRAPPALFV